MTDAEVICGWMQQFYRGTGIWNPPLTLDALREVEERLTEEQWRDYRRAAITAGWYRDDWCIQHDRTTMFQYAVHASAEHKIKALAAVLRAEKRDGRVQ